MTNGFVFSGICTGGPFPGARSDAGGGGGGVERVSNVNLGSVTALHWTGLGVMERRVFCHPSLRYFSSERDTQRGRTDG